MATRVLVVVEDVEVEDYGSTHGAEERVVSRPWMVDPPRSPPSLWKTQKWRCAGILGMTAVVALSVLLFVSRMDSSSSVLRATRIEDAVLLHRKDGTCVVQSSDWIHKTKLVIERVVRNSYQPLSLSLTIVIIQIMS